MTTKMTNSPNKNTTQYMEEENLFLTASSRGKPENCTYWIERGININARNRFGQTALILASQNGHFDIVKLLVDCEADEQLVDNWGYNALMKAAGCGHSSIFELLAKENCGILKGTLLGQVTTLTESTLAGHMEIIKLSLNKYPECIDTPTELTQMTPLMLSVIGGHYNAVEFLLQNGARAPIRNSSGLTARDLSAQCGDCEILALLNSYAARNFGNAHITINVTSADDEDEYDKGMNWDRAPAKINVTPTSRIPRSSKKSLITEHVSRKLMRKSKSEERRPTPKNLNSTVNGIFEYILQSNGLQQFWPLFKAQEVDLKVFLTLQEEDFHSIGIVDEEFIFKLIDVVQHYKPLFNL